MTHTDRGPNGEPITLDKKGSSLRPFIDPNFQPRWVKLETNSQNSTLKIIEEILLTDAHGAPLSGRPQWHAKDHPHSDEKPINLAGQSVPMDLGGIDPEGLAQDADGNFWMCDEYRPTLLKFSPRGKLIKRFVPKNSLPPGSAKNALAVLPEIYGTRKSNRGFEGIAHRDGKIYAIVQSPLEIPGALHQKIARVLEFDVKTETVTGELFYPLVIQGVEKIGDLSSLAELPGLFAIEQNSKTGPQGIHLITHFELKPKWMNETPELKEFSSLQELDQLLTLKKIASVTEVGYDFAEKVEGLALISPSEFAIINDNDFGLDGPLDRQKQTIPISTKRPTVLAIMKLPSSLSFPADAVSK